MSAPLSYKPSPLSYASPPSRSSPFRRAESPASSSPLRHTTVTPNGSPTKLGTANGVSRFGRPTTPTSSSPRESWTPRGSSTPGPRNYVSPSTMPQKQTQAGATVAPKGIGAGSALSQLQPSQVRALRDGFQILDRDCDGTVNREDVADMLNQLGLPSGPADVTPFFPPSAPQTMALAAFLNTLADTLSAISPSAELLSAFSAFDSDDSGQIDAAEMRDALINTAPEPGQRALTAADVDKVIEGFTGRRAFNRNMNAQLGARKGQVFKYQDFVNSIMGTGPGSEGPSQEISES